MLFKRLESTIYEDKYSGKYKHSDKYKKRGFNFDNTRAKVSRASKIVHNYQLTPVTHTYLQSSY